MVHVAEREVVAASARLTPARASVEADDLTSPAQPPTPRHVARAVSRTARGGCTEAASCVAIALKLLDSRIRRLASPLHRPALLLALSVARKHPRPTERHIKRILHKVLSS